jgi:hypothetical protein
MKFGFDLDGTLDHEEIRMIANTLFDAGHEVHILTGFVPGGTYTEQMKLDKCQRLKLKYTKLHLCQGDSMEDIGYVKAQTLRQYDIPFMIDDDPTFVRQMTYYSTSRIVMIVR